MGLATTKRAKKIIDVAFCGWRDGRFCRVLARKWIAIGLRDLGHGSDGKWADFFALKI